MNFFLKYILLLNVFYNHAYCSSDKEYDKLLEDYKNDIKYKIMNSEAGNQNFKAKHKNILRDSKLINIVSKKDKFAFIAMKRTIINKDEARRFFNGPIVTNIAELPVKGESESKPWSSSHFPIKYGGLSVRYNIMSENNTLGYYNRTTRNLERFYTWKESVNKYKQPEEHHKFYSGNETLFQNYIDENYSPAEKYDILVGDIEYTLTNTEKNYGRKFSRNEDVALWMGICHGWAPAAYLALRPEKPVSLIAADGRTNITFLPDDIRGLVNQFWAKANIYTNFMGSVCRKDPNKYIPHDYETGLWSEYNCFSVNPGSLAIILGNQLGIRKRNLVIDPEADSEVWNQPLYAYSMQYYDLINTGNFTYNHEEVKKQISEVRKHVNTHLRNGFYYGPDMAFINNTKYLRYLLKKAPSNTQSFVGVKFTVNYTLANALIHYEEPMDDEVYSQEYTAALELDNKGNIIGGEWTNNTHIDFVWKPDERYQPYGVQDKTVTKFEGTVEELKNITNNARIASKQQNVLKAVIDYLLIKSSKNVTDHCMANPSNCINDIIN